MPAFYDYGYCICEAWETGQGEVFCKRYGTLLDSQLKPFEKNPDLVEVVVLFLERNNYEWESKMQYFSIKLNELAALSDADIKIPSVPNYLSREINKLQFEFKKAGVTIEMSKMKWSWLYTFDLHKYISQEYHGKELRSCISAVRPRNIRQSAAPCIIIMISGKPIFKKYNGGSIHENHLKPGSGSERNFPKPAGKRYRHIHFHAQKPEPQPDHPD